MLVWEPRRVVPTYAVPPADVDGEVAAAPATADEPRRPGTTLPRLGDRPVLDPSDPVRRAHDRRRAAAHPRARRRARRSGFRPADPELDGYVIARLRGLRRVVRGGRAQRRPPARPVPPDRHRPQLAARAGRARRRGARGVHAARTCCSSRRCRSATTCRGGRAHRPARAERHAHRVRLQGPGVVLVARRRPTTSPGPTAAPLREAAEVDGPHRVLQRARRRGRRRRAARAPGHALVALSASSDRSRFLSDCVTFVTRTSLT